MTSDRQNVELSDTELNQLLQHASKPKPRADFDMRLLEKMRMADTPSNIFAFPRSRKIPIWITALPLAASLILGIWLGSSDTVFDYLPNSTQTVMQGANTDTLYILTEDNLS